MKFWLKMLGCVFAGLAILSFALFKTTKVIDPAIWSYWNEAERWLPIVQIMLVNAVFPITLGLLIGIRIGPFIRMTLSEKMKRLSQWSLIALLFSFIGFGFTTGVIDFDASVVGLNEFQARMIGLTVGIASIAFLLVVSWILAREARIVDENEL